MAKYDHKKIEQKWQKVWDETGLYHVDDASKKSFDTAQDKPKFYCLDMFPYPSGSGLHVGHPKGYIATDVFSRFKTHQGYKVLHPMGWDAFGLPTENYAIKNKINPRAAAAENVKRFKEQLQILGFNYDWNREINTTDPEFYRWTQWIFVKLFEKGLAYQSYEPINWCPSCKTGLSMEDLEGGKCERCGGDVEQRPMRQWVLKITDYADRLLEDLKILDWEEQIIEQQRNWIGRSEGAKVRFPIYSSSEQRESRSSRQSSNNNYIEVFTTRIDTLYGATFMVLAPEHPFVTRLLNNELQIPNNKQIPEIKKYVEETKKKTDLQRQQEKKKTGVFTGAYAINPVNGEQIPIWISDYVLIGYGTGAIMAVPAHDERDYEFAKKFDLPIKEVVAPYFLDTVNKPREDKKTEKRDVACMIVRNPKDNKYLCLKWKSANWLSFPTGGIDGEDLVVAARREIQEETGYKNLKLIEKMPGSCYAEFYRPHKDSNVIAHFKYVVFDLENEDREAVEQKEKDLHEPVWIDEKKVGGYLNVLNQIYAWERLHDRNKLFSQNGILVDSAEFSSLTSEEAKKAILAKLSKEKKAEKAVSYKIKDWVFSRQRYWGEPMPLVFCEECKKRVENYKLQITNDKQNRNSKIENRNSDFSLGELANPGWVSVPEDKLPLTLPEVVSYEPTGTGESPLAAIAEWVNTTCPKCGGPAKRETDTMPQWAGSSWYYLRYIDPKNSDALVDPKKEKEWMPVDLYVGGIEHATRHLLYARFWHKFLYDIGAVSTLEPFKRLIHVGLILAEDGRKMSKRWNNVINPDDMVAEYGADALRVYEMFMGPFTQYIAWNTQGVKGARRFLEKVNELGSRKDWPTISKTEIEVKLNKLIKKIEADIEEFKFNTAIAAFMEFVNVVNENKNEISRVDFEKFLILLNPFAPHLTEELWEELGNTDSICLASWPKYDKKLTVDELVGVAIQIDGKVRDTLLVSPDAVEDDVFTFAKESGKVAKYLHGKKIKKSFYVAGKILSIVTE